MIRLDLLGDVVLSLPAVRSLKKAYPSARIDMLVRPSAVPIVQAAPDVANVLTFDPDKIRPSGKPFSLSSWRELWRMAGRVRGERYDLTVGLFGVWASVFAVASGSPRRIGYLSEGMPFAYNEPVGGRRYHPIKHERGVCLNLALRAGGARDASGPFLEVSPGVRRRADELVTSYQLEREQTRNVAVGRPVPTNRCRRVVAHLGSTSGSAKRWTAAGWSGLLQSLQHDGHQVVVVGSPDEMTLAEEVRTAGYHEPVVLTGKTGLEELLGVLQSADLVIGGDSGPLHIAEALGRPVLAIHGPSDPRISGPTGSRSSVVRLPIDCSPCYDATYAAECPLGHHRCMAELTSDGVYRRAKRMLAEQA